MRLAEHERRLEHARRLGEHVLEPRQLTEGVLPFEHRGLVGQSHAIDAVWQAGCHGPRIIGASPPCVKARVSASLCFCRLPPHSFWHRLPPTGAPCSSGSGSPSNATPPESMSNGRRAKRV